MKLVGIDVGGTFTDAILMDTETGEVWKTKVPTTTRTPHECFLDGLQEVCEAAGVAPADIAFVTHGTTIATNVVVERTGAELALITTAGFRDVLAIGRTKRDELYDLNYHKPEPLVPRCRRYEIDERTTADGSVRTPVDPADVEAVLGAMPDSVDCIVVTLLHAYANPENERRVVELLETNTEKSVVASHEILPVFREFGRLSTTVLNGYVKPAVVDYLTALQTELDRIDADVVEPLLATMSGGQVPIDRARDRPGTLFLSGPANGPAGASFVGEAIDRADLVTFDMGGTSCDVSLVRGGEPSITTETEIDGHQFNLPTVDIETIAAGGGSIGWVDDAGILRVGPRSAGADPGPACYGAGGTDPTVTDANLVLGRYNADTFMGGTMDLDVDAAAAAIRERVADPLDMDLHEAAAGMLRIANSRMADAIETITVERGVDPSEFALVAFGGAGPSHAPAIAAELPIPAVICSPFSSVLSAFGLVVNPVKFELQATRDIENVPGRIDDIRETFRELERRGRRRLDAVGGAFESIRFDRSVDAKYRGQRWDTSIPVTDADLEDSHAIVDRFHAVHEDRYTYRQPDQPVHLSNFHVTAVGEFADPSLRRPESTGRPVAEAHRTDRPVVFDGRDHETAIYEGAALEPAHEFEGPAIVEYVDTTVVIPPTMHGTVDDYGNVRVAGGAP